MKLVVMMEPVAASDGASGSRDRASSRRNGANSSRDWEEAAERGPAAVDGRAEGRATELQKKETTKVIEEMVAGEQRVNSKQSERPSNQSRRGSS